jgi:hypothetical protein
MLWQRPTRLAYDMDGIGVKETCLIEGETFGLANDAQADGGLLLGWPAPVKLDTVILQALQGLLVLVIADADDRHLGELDADNEVRHAATIATCTGPA